MTGCVRAFEVWLVVAFFSSSTDGIPCRESPRASASATGPAPTMATGVWAVDVSPVHSVFTGITTAYLFLKLFPELGVEVGRDLGLDGSAELLRRLVYAFALLGLTAFYAAEVWAHRGTAHRARPMRDERVYHLLLVPFALGAAAFGIVLLLVERFAP